MTKKPAILCLTETHITDQILEKELEINKNYTLYNCKSNSSYTGGIMVFISNQISIKKVNMKSLDYQYWFLHITFKVKYLEYELCVYYRSPSCNTIDFLNFFKSICEEIWESNNIIVHLGDFNINYISDDGYVRKLKEIINLYGMKQLVTKFTRVTDKSKSIIDLVISNDFLLKVNIIDTPKLSDHSWQSIEIEQIYSITQSTKLITFIDYKNLKNKLICCDWKYDITDINMLFNNIYKNVENSVNEVKQIKTICLKNNNTPWFNKNIYDAKFQRDNMYQRFCLTNDIQDWNEYKRLRNICLDTIRREKKGYYEREIDKNKGDSKKMWKTLQNLVSFKVTNGVSEIIFEDKKETDPTIIAERLNEYYIQSIEDISKSIPVSQEEFLTSIVFEETFSSFTEISLNQLKNKIFKLKSNNNFNEVINKTLLKETFDVIGYQILNFVNNCLRKGEMPDDLKCSYVTPVTKIKNSKKFDEMRPINVLWDIEKLLEEIIYEQLIDYIEENKILVKWQSGFRRQHSTEIAVQYVIECWKRCFEENEKVVAVFLDFKRAFETIDRKRLLKKLENYGISGTVLNFFKNYLSKRAQRTKILNIISSKKANDIGVPQGSKLGPLLFILYINDLPEILKKCKIQMFADDTLIYITNKSIFDAINIINSELKTVVKWLNTNLLKLNVDKTKCMLINSNSLAQNPRVKINNVDLQLVNSFKYLGVFIDAKLKFEEYYEYIISKISGKINYLKRISQNLSVFCKKCIYNTIILPHFLYCATILYTANENVFEKLQILQNKAMRTILNTDKFCKSIIMLKKLNWLNIKNLIFFNVCIFLYKIQNNLLPDQLKEYITQNFEYHEHNTRFKNDFHLNNSSKLVVYKSIFHKGINEYNKLKDTIKNQKNFKKFKTALKNYLYLKQFI